MKYYSYFCKHKPSNRQRIHGAEPVENPRVRTAGPRCRRGVQAVRRPVAGLAQTAGGVVPQPYRPVAVCQGLLVVVPTSGRGDGATRCCTQFRLRRIREAPLGSLAASALQYEPLPQSRNVYTGIHRCGMRRGGDTRHGGRGCAVPLFLAGGATLDMRGRQSADRVCEAVDTQGSSPQDARHWTDRPAALAHGISAGAGCRFPNDGMPPGWLRLHRMQSSPFTVNDNDSFFH